MRKYVFLLAFLEDTFVEGLFIFGQPLGESQLVGGQKFQTTGQERLQNFNEKFSFLSQNAKIGFFI